MTDDLVVHPLSPTYMDHGERVDHSHALGEAVRKKEKLYDSALSDHDEERWRVSCWPPEGDLIALCLHISWRLVRARG